MLIISIYYILYIKNIIYINYLYCVFIAIT